MKRFDWLSADILHKRLKDNGNSPVSNYSVKKIKRKGVSLGIFILVFVISLCSGTYIYGKNLLAHKKYLQSLEAEFNLLDKKYRETLKLVNEIKKINGEIATGILGIKSGSALLSEISKITPKTVQLEKIESNDFELKAKGIASQPNGLLAVNALKIQFENSLFLNEDYVKLDKAWEAQVRDNSDNKLTNILNFKINAKFSENYNAKLIKYLDQLGSVGLAKRVSLLTDEGLIND